MHREDKLAYALEKFGQAINDLTYEPGNPRDWLKAAWLRFCTVRPDDLPDGELRALFVGIKADLTSKRGSGKEGRVAATLQRMSDEKVFELIDRITSYYRRLRDAWDAWSPEFYARPAGEVESASDGPRLRVIIHEIVAPGGRRVGAIATILGTKERLEQEPGESDEAFEARVEAAIPNVRN
jgi:hypothetical protein